MTNRLMYWAPWNVTRPWLPRWFRGGDEWGNASIAFVLPLLGCLVVFYTKDFKRDGDPVYVCTCESCDRERTP